MFLESWLLTHIKYHDDDDDDDDFDGDPNFTDGARAAEDGRQEGQLLLREASTRLSELSVREGSDERVIVSPSYLSLESDIPEQEAGHRAGGGTQLRREEGEMLSATAAAAASPQKRAKLRSSTTKARKKSTLASKWRRQRERQRSREPSPPSPESPPPSPFDNVTQGLSTIG